MPSRLSFALRPVMGTSSKGVPGFAAENLSKWSFAKLYPYINVLAAEQGVCAGEVNANINNKTGVSTINRPGDNRQTPKETEHFFIMIPLLNKAGRSCRPKPT